MPAQADLKMSSPVSYGSINSYNKRSYGTGSLYSSSYTSSYSSSYGSKYRTSSLERTPAQLREAISSLRSTTTSDNKYSYSRPPRPSIYSNGSESSSSSSSGSPSSSFSRKSDTLRSLELRSRFPSRYESSSINLRSKTSPLKAIHPRSDGDAIHSDYKSPVLTSYRPSRTSSIERKDYSNGTSSYGRTGLRDSPDLSTVVPRISTSSHVDENSNQTPITARRRSRYDNNHNETDCDENSSGNNYLSGSSSPTPRRSGGSSSGYSSGSGYGSDNASSPSLRSSSSSIHDQASWRMRDHSDKAGLVGLRNLGNTCFMNSILQCLSNSQPLTEYCLKDHYYSEINTSNSTMHGSLMKAYASLMKSMWKSGGSSADSVVSPQDFKKQIERFAPRFAGYSQQDSQELLRYVLSGLHEDVNRVITKPKGALPDIDDDLSDSQKAAESWKRYLRYDNSKIVDLFVGQLKSTLRCTVCGHCSVTFDPFWDLSLPIPKGSGSVKLSQCLDLFTSEETLDGDEKPTCAKCKTRRKCTKSFSIYKFPVLLALHLKRFSPNERFRAKLSTLVDFPLNRLNLSAYAANNSPDGSCQYNLYAVSNHSGTTYSGHYTAYCKNPYSQEWHDFNDSKVSNISNNSIASSEAYVLFYEQAAQTSRL